MRQWKEYSELVYEAFKSTPSVEEMRARIADANINSQSLLATDYLNHFNEVAMILEMLPDMPDFVEDVKSWSLKSYKQHFLESTFSDKDLAVAAYDCVPTPYFLAFEGAINRAATLIQNSIPNIDTAIETSDRDQIELVTKEVCTGIEELMSSMRSIVNGELGTLEQGEIDAMLLSAEGDDQVADTSSTDIEVETLAAEAEDLNQNAIDSLFD